MEVEAGRPMTPGADLVLRVTYKADAASTSGTAGGEGGAGAGAAAAPVYKPVTVVVGAQDSVEDVRQNALTLVNRRLVLEGKDEVEVVALEQCGRVFYRTAGSGTGAATSSSDAAADAGTPPATAEAEAGAAAPPLKASSSGAKSAASAAAQPQQLATARTPALSVIVAEQPLVAHVRTAPCLHVTLEGNAAGACPVSVPLAALGAGGGGGHEEEVMVSDLVTAAIKALKTRYGPTQAGAALTAHILEAGAPGGRRLLPTFDALPRRLLAAGDAHVVLSGVTCGDMGVVMSDEPAAAAGPGLDSDQALRKSESGASHAPVIPLPGYTADPLDPLEPHTSAISLSGPGGLVVGAAASCLSHSGSLAAGGGAAATSAHGLTAGAVGCHNVPLGAAGGSEELRLESAAPSTTSLHGAALRGGQKLPPMGDDGDSSRRKLAGLAGVSPSAGPASGGGGGGGGGGGTGPGSAPLKGSRLGQATYADSEPSVHSRASLEPDAVRTVRKGDGVGAMPVLAHTDTLGRKGQGPVAAVAAGGQPGLVPAVISAAAPAPIRTSTSGAVRQSENGAAARQPDAGGADAPPVAKKGFLIPPGSAPEDASTSGNSSNNNSNNTSNNNNSSSDSVAPLPPAVWSDFMPATDEPGPDGAPGPAASGGVCLGLMAMFSAGARAQQQAVWRARLRAALACGDAAELAAWLEFHTSRGGGRDQAELDAVLWLALEAGGGSGKAITAGVGAEADGAKGPAPSLVRVLLRGGAAADAPRPTGQVVGASGGSGSGPNTPHGARAARNRVAPAGAASAAALEGATPLMRAAELGSLALVEVLLDGGASPAVAQPGSGLTALHRAIIASPAEPAWTAQAAGANAAGKRGPGGQGQEAGPQHAALRCAAMLLEEMGADKARKLRCGAVGDDLVRFAVRHGRGDAVRWLLAAGLTPAAPAEEASAADDQASCAYLAGQLAVTLDVWDLPPPPPAAAPPLRDPLRPASDPAWVLGAEEKRFAANRRQLLCGAAAAGRLDVINRLLDKPPPYDRLRRDELEAALAAARRGSAAAAAAATAAPANTGASASQRQVEELLSKRAHTCLNWDRELLPALQRFDLEVVSEWLLRDFPSPAAVDRALAATLTAERLSLPLWQDAAVATVRALIAGGADVNYVWEVPAAAAAASAAAAAHLGGGGGGGQAAAGHAVLTPLLAALQAPAPAVVAALLAAGADPRRRDAPGGENALAFAVRVAERAARSASGAASGGDDHLGHLLGGGRYAAHAPGSAEAAAAASAAGVAVATLLDTDYAPELLTARNEHGQSPVFMAAVLDLPAILQTLVSASAAADPWAKAAAAPPPTGVTSTDTPLDLLPLPAGSAGAPASSSAARPAAAAAVLVAPPGQWSAAHEAARCGALGSLGLLLGSGANPRPLLPPGAAPPPPEVAAARLRDALVGAIRGGRVGAAKLLSDLQARGLYERELAAALSLAKSCAAAPPAPPPGLVAAGAAGADPARYEALLGFLSSQAHVYMDWAGEVLPALRGGNAAAIQRWISGDRITADDASRALVALVEGAQPCKDSAATAAAAASESGGAVGHGSGLASLGLGGGGGGGGGGLELGGGASSKALLSKGPTARSVAEIAAALVRAGADVNATVPSVDPVTAAPAGGSSSNSGNAAFGGSSSGRQTLLMAAAVRGSLPLVEVLLAVGARVDAEDGSGCTAVDLAILARQRLGGSDGPGKPVLAALLAAYGERRLNTHRTAAGDSALMLAVRTTHQDAVAQLLEAGATPAAADASEPTPAFAAATGGAAAGGGGEGGAEDGDQLSDLPRPGGGAGGLTSLGSRRVLGKLPSGAARKGSAVYLAAKMEDKALLHMLLKKASLGEGMNACRTEVQLGALHGGRVTLLEASLAVPDLLKAVPGPTPPEGGGSAALGAAEQACARLAEQAAVRLEEAQALLRELAAANLAAASGEAAAALAPADSARVSKYLTAKTKVLEEVFGCHEHMRLFYATARAALHGLEAGLRQRRDDMASKLSGSAAAQMRLVGLQSKLAASKDDMLRTIAAKRDATLAKVEALFDARLRGLEEAARRGEAGVQQQMETAIMEVRRTVARRLKEIEDKKTEGYNRLTTIERRVDALYTRKQRALASKPPAARTALNTAAASLRQELQSQRASLAERVDEAIRKMEGAQRRAGASALNMEAVRQELTALAKRQAQEARAAADRAHAAVAARADELQAGDKHDDLLRIVGGMAAEVSRGSAASAAVSNSLLTALSAAFGAAEGALHQQVEEGRTRMQAFLSNAVTTHVAYVAGLMAQQQADSEEGGGGAGAAAAAAAAAPADDTAAAGAPEAPPNVDALLSGLDTAHALDGIDLAVSSSGAAGEAEPPPSQLPNLEAVEEMLEDMIGGMQEQVLAAFPDDGIVDSLPLADVAVLVDADADLDTGGLGLGSLRDTLAGLDLELPDLDVNPECVDLSVLEEEAILGAVPGAMPAAPYGMMPPPGAGAVGMMPPPGAMPYPPPYGMMPPPGYGPMPPGYGPYGYYDPYAAGLAYQQQQQRREEDEHEEETKRAGKYNAANYGDRHEDDFAMSYS